MAASFMANEHFPELLQSNATLRQNYSDFASVKMLWMDGEMLNGVWNKVV